MDNTGSARYHSKSASFFHRDLIEGRTGLSLNQHLLMIGTKPLQTRHSDLSAAEYGIQRNQTLFLQGSLKGGFGERAAMADVILRELDHGNVLGDIEQTEGESKALVRLGRDMLNPKKNAGKQFCRLLYAKLESNGSLPSGGNSEMEMQRWIAQNKTSLSASTASYLQAGNCNEYANIVYTSLLSKTKNQIVCRASMKDGYDHAFVITSPHDHGDDVAALCDDPDAMVADAWWKGTICTFRDFVEGKNPYDENVELKNLRIKCHQSANGGAPLSPELDSAVRGVAAQIDKIRTRELAKNAREAKAKAHAIATANALVQQCRRNVREARQRGAFAITDEQSRAAKKDEAAAQAALSRANRLLATARDAMRRVFGDPGDIWPKDEIDDAREQSDLFRTFDRAFELGGAEQLEVAMERVTEQEFVEYVRGNDAALHRVLASDKLGRQFQGYLRSFADNDFWQVCLKLSSEEWTKYIRDNDELSTKYFRANTSLASFPLPSALAVDTEMNSDLPIDQLFDHGLPTLNTDSTPTDFDISGAFSTDQLVQLQSYFVQDTNLTADDDWADQFLNL